MKFMFRLSFLFTRLLTTAEKDEEARELLKLLGMPFKN